jgi:hypothetical protein
VLVDGILVGAVASYTFTSVTTNHTVAVTFTSQSAAPVPALNPLMVIGTGLALCGMLRIKKRFLQT